MKLAGIIISTVLIFFAVQLSINQGITIYSFLFWIFSISVLGIIYYYQASKDISLLKKQRWGSFIKGISIACIITWFMGQIFIGFDSYGLGNFFIFSLLGGILGLLISLSLAFS